LDNVIITENDGYALVNIAELLVKKKVKELMETYDMCHCEKCYRDACAIVLNEMEPRYVTTQKGFLLSLLSATYMQYKTDLAVYVLRALKTVNDSPRH